MPEYKSRIVFIGCVAEGKECLQEILDVGGNVVAILTFTEELFEKTSGAVRFDDIGEKYGIPIFRVKTTNAPEPLALLRELQPDAIFVVGWTRLVNAEVLAIPRYGCFGMHASLLPDYRGRAPVNWALIRGERIWGNTLMVLDEGIDTGDIVNQKKFDITLADTCKTVYDKVARAGREMIQEIVPLLDTGTFARVPQTDRNAPSLPKRTPQDGIIDWSRSSFELYNWVRALTHPYPGAFTYLRGRKLFVWEARICHHPWSVVENASRLQDLPGTILSVEDGILVSTGASELLSLHAVSFESEPETSWRQFVEENTLKPGEVFAGEQAS